MMIERGLISQIYKLAHTTHTYNSLSKNKPPNQKMGRRPAQTFFQRWHTVTWKDAPCLYLLEKCT